LKYIQCQHCEKKYAASEKLCAASGKKIRCKHCQQIFEIFIHDDQVCIEQENTASTASEEAATANIEKDPEAPAIDDDAAALNSTLEQEEPPDNKPKKNTAPVKKKLNIQLFISMALGVTLLAIATTAYLFFYHHDLFEPSKKQAEKAIIPHQLIKPVSIPFPQQKHTTASGKSKQKPAQPAPRVQKAKSLLDGPDNPSQVCKDSAADYWFRTRLLTTVQLDTATYMELLNQNLDQAEEIRRLCKDKLLIARIADAAKTEQIPAWISSEIKSRSNAAPTQKEPQKVP